MGSKKKLNRLIQNRIAYDQYKREHPDECWCPQNDVKYPEIPQELDFENPIQDGIFKCLICFRNKPYSIPHA